MSNITVGSICSGIEAASVAWKNLGFKFEWFSEIAPFPSKLLNLKYPSIANLGDMSDIPEKLTHELISAPDLICGGTPCQAFSLAGWKKGLDDVRGNLTLTFVDIINANDSIRIKQKKAPTIVLWENVEGVLRDKTNAFGCLISSLAGYEDEIKPSQKWASAGLLRGPLRNVAWRLIDAKYFGLPQQRKRLYLLAGGKDFNPEEILFELSQANEPQAPENNSLIFNKDGHSFEVFREYTDCLYSAYGTKWNGNAAAYNGSLFVVQNNRLRRFTPLECERLMGFPDNYTNIAGIKPTARYQAVGNSWAVPVIKWLGERISSYFSNPNKTLPLESPYGMASTRHDEVDFLNTSKDRLFSKGNQQINTEIYPVNTIFGNIKDIVDVAADEKFYLTPVGCSGILRRKEERGLTINKRLELVLRKISSAWSEEQIESVSRKQSRGRFSLDAKVATPHLELKTLSLW